MLRPIDMDSLALHEDIPGGVPLKLWTRGVPVELSLIHI